MSTQSLHSLRASWLINTLIFIKTNTQQQQQQGNQSTAACQVTNNCTSPSLTQVPVRQRVVIVVIIFLDVLTLLSLPSFVLQGDCARLVETRLDVLLAVWDRLILLHVTLGKWSKSRLMVKQYFYLYLKPIRPAITLTFSSMMSISEYFIPFTKIGISL